MIIEQYIPKKGESSLKCYVAQHKDNFAFGYSHANAMNNLLLKLRTLTDYKA